jgi:hypothetical protein
MIFYSVTFKYIIIIIMLIRKGNAPPKGILSLEKETKMAKIMHVQTVLVVDEIEALKAKTGEPNTKDALAKAVQHYLECEYTRVEDMWTKKLENVVKKRTKEITVEEN